MYGNYTEQASEVTVSVPAFMPAESIADDPRRCSFVICDSLVLHLISVNLLRSGRDLTVMDQCVLHLLLYDISFASSVTIE